MPDNPPRHQHVMFPQSLRAVSWMDVRLAVDRGAVANLLFVLNAVNSAVLVLAPFN